MPFVRRPTKIAVAAENAAPVAFSAQEPKIAAEFAPSLLQKRDCAAAESGLFCAR